MTETPPSFYRFTSAGRGIFAAVDLDCPRSDIRRNEKPDGSWLPKVGANYPGAVSLWTEFGLERYLESGLQDWHRRVVNSPFMVFEKSMSIVISDSIKESSVEGKYLS